MQENNEIIFRNLTQLEPPHGLLGSIVARIMREQRRSARVWVGFLLGSVLASCAVLIPAVQYAAREFIQSGFYQYLSLAFSDGGVLLASWKEFLLLLAESLPLTRTVLVLTILFVMLGSLRLMMRDMKTAFL